MCGSRSVTAVTRGLGTLSNLAILFESARISVPPGHIDKHSLALENRRFSSQPR